jgi:hypothetical protein
VKIRVQEVSLISNALFEIEKLALMVWFSFGDIPSPITDWETNMI